LAAPDTPEELGAIAITASRPKIPLHALRSFEAAARLGSFKTAAEELGVTPAAISHMVKRLEAQLGLSLFDRLHRSLRVTPAGRRLCEVVRAALRDIERALDDLVEDGVAAGPRTLSVTAAPSLAGKWLAPRLHAFQAMYPQIELRLSAGDTLVDLARRKDVDIGLRYGCGDYGDELLSEPLWPRGRLIVVCAPAVADALKTPADLLRFSLLRVATPRDEQSVLSGWRTWLVEAGVSAEQAQRSAAVGPLFGSTQLALDATMGGQGVTLSPDVIVQDDLRAGRLVQPFAVTIADPWRYWIVFRKDRSSDPRIRAFKKWLIEAAASSD
jgi:DNA-binding transcriptional LysR family regulator